MQGAPGFPGEGLPGPKVSSRMKLVNYNHIIMWSYSNVTSLYPNILNVSFRLWLYDLSVGWCQCDMLFLTLPVCLLQGDRGYEGLKGSRGLQGVGQKGDKVRLSVGWDRRHTYKGWPVWPLTCLTFRETQEAPGCQVWLGFQGQASKEKRQVQ